jgi:hypothetical protein
MFQIGDKVEREIDGLFFEAQVKQVHEPPARSSLERGQRRCFTYNLLYPDTKNTEQDVPEDEIRLKVGRRRGTSNKLSGTENIGEDTNSSKKYEHKYRYRSTSEQTTATVAPKKSAFVLIGDQEHEGVPHTSVVDEGKKFDSDDLDNDRHSSSSSPSSSDLLHLNPFATTVAEQEKQKKGGKINVHNMDDNERFQSTGSAYITHGHVGQHDKKGAGGGGLRAIRMLRK